MSNPSQARTKVFAALHRSRLQPYLDASGGNERDALKLYRWNLQLSAALQELLSVTEVVLRNAIDRELQAWNKGETGHSSWLLMQPASPLRSLTAGKRVEANTNARKAQAARVPSHGRHGATPTHDDVLAQVMFGMWKELLPNHVPNAGNSTENANRARMWSEALEKAFPNVSDPVGEETFWRVQRLHLIRNRVSHMETLLNQDVSGRASDALNLVRSIDQDVHTWLSGMNRVTSLVKGRPGS